MSAHAASRPAPVPFAIHVPRLRTFVREHPDLVLLSALLVVTIGIRAMFALRAPLFLRHDSVAYFQTGYEWARGQGFDLPLRRTPLYPLFIGVVVWSFGEDLRTLAVAQHTLALVSVAATYWLGRALFGRLAGFLAALLTALSAPLLIYEHYILTEPLFIPLLLLGTLLVVRALQGRPSWLYLAGGVVLALAALARPIGQVLLPVAPIAILAHTLGRGGVRAAVKPAVLVVAGFMLVLGPWMARGWVVEGRAGGAGALGQTLVGRIIRHDEGFVLPSPDSPSRHTDPTKIAVRRLILTQMARDARPSAINHRVRNQFGLTEAEANAAMQDVAIEIFTDQPRRYVEGTIAKYRKLMIGEDEQLRAHWGTRRDGELRDDWTSEASIAHLYSPPSAIEERERPTAEALTRVFQPVKWWGALAVLAVVGIGYGLVRGPRGPTVLLVLTILALTVPSAALVGNVPRYRYPTDPLLLVLAGGGVTTAISAARRLPRSWRQRHRRAGASTPPATLATS